LRAEHQHPGPHVLAPGYFALEFPGAGAWHVSTAAAASAADGAVLDDSGHTRHLYDFMGDRVVLLSFIYTTCSDVNGCPLAAYVLKRVQDRAVTDPNLRAKLRIVSLSLRPQHDTPAVMAEYGARLRAPGSTGRF
jgi:cytochrome c peroxidase